MRYGLPYQGSKNDIALWVIEHLPPADVLIDAFAGGCAVTHAALLSGRFKRVVANDVNDTPTLFADAIAGKYANETRWISREDFHALKGSDPYVRQCWSFKNDGETYLYGAHIEQYKKAYHYAAVFGDYSLFDAMGIVVPTALRDKGREMTIRERISMLKRWIRANYDYIASIVAGLADEKHAGELQSLQSLESLESLERLQNLERLESLERLQTLQPHTHRLTTRQGDYTAIPLPTNETYTIYCDPPYKTTNCGHYGGFDHDRFYDWLRTTDHPIVVSEYSMPEDFVEIDKCTKQIKSAGVGNLRGCERLFVHASQYDKLPKTTLF